MITIFGVIFVIILGLLGGTINGLTGLSGIGLILMGLSVGHIINDYRTTIGTVLYLLMFPTTLFGAIEYNRNHKIDFFVGNLLLISMIIGTFIGVKLSLLSKYKLTEKTIKYITAIIGIFIGFYFLIVAYNMK
jgi:uncharacterized membrane protein YfcA